MTINDYLKGLLTSQDLTTQQESDLQKHKDEITKFLRAEFGEAPVIKYAGSREKGTMIRDNYDLDVVCYFPSSDTRSLKEIRDDVSARLGERYVLEPKASAERIRDLKGATAPASYHIDVVPGRFIEGTKDVFLHVQYGDRERMQTNLKTHIDFIVNSGCVDVIRLMKLWICRNNLTFKTFVLELFVVQALSGFAKKGDLKAAVIKVFEEMEENLESTQLVDPANTNNIVSRVVSATDKSLLADAASDALSTIDGSDDLSKWKSVFGEGGNRGVPGVLPYVTPAPAAIVNPSGPWAA